jgi:5'-methylthioadenosine nucleosidase
MADLVASQLASINGDRVVKHVLVLVAMEAEAAPFIQALNLQKVYNPNPHPPIFQYKSANPESGEVVSVALNGKSSAFGVDNVGTAPAALTTFLAINQLQPDLVINAGTCGGFKAKGSAICDAYISTHTKNHDRRIPIPGFDTYGIGSVASFPCPNLVASLGLKTGVVTTGNSLDHTEMDDKIMAQNGEYQWIWTVVSFYHCELCIVNSVCRRIMQGHGSSFGCLGCCSF